MACLSRWCGCCDERRCSTLEWRCVIISHTHAFCSHRSFVLRSIDGLPSTCRVETFARRVVADHGNPTGIARGWKLMVRRSRGMETNVSRLIRARMEKVVRNSRWNVAVLYFYGASAVTSQFAIYFFQTHKNLNRPACLYYHSNANWIVALWLSMEVIINK